MRKFRFIKREKKDNWEKYTKYRQFPGMLLFLCGFVAGNIIPNLLWRMKWQQKTMASVYLLGTFANAKMTGMAYLREVLRFRGSIYIVTAICGLSVFGVPLAVVEAILTGLATGALLSVSVLQFGFTGGIIGLGLLMPQYIIYIPVWMFLWNRVWNMSLRTWNDRGLFPHQTAEYALKMFLGVFPYGAGILMESYLNPRITEYVLKFVKFF